jgi:coproporphyrinogen III oxidase-like Fe-S oxidoreductase
MPPLYTLVYCSVASAQADEEERETAKRLQNLVSILKQNLSQQQVYRVGSTDIDTYIVGGTPSGGLAGLSTKRVETWLQQAKWAMNVS